MGMLLLLTLILLFSDNIIIIGLSHALPTSFSNPPTLDLRRMLHHSGRGKEDENVKKAKLAVLMGGRAASNVNLNFDESYMASEEGQRQEGSANNRHKLLQKARKKKGGRKRQKRGMEAAFCVDYDKPETHPPINN